MLLLTRYAFPHTALLGVLSLRGTPLCYTLEPTGTMAIRPGTYPLRLTTGTGMAMRYQARFGEMHMAGMVEVCVPDRTYLYFHSGNTVADTTGCILVGTSSHISPPRVGFSQQAYLDVYPILREYVDGPQPELHIREQPCAVLPWWPRLMRWGRLHRRGGSNGPSPVHV